MTLTGPLFATNFAKTMAALTPLRDFHTNSASKLQRESSLQSSGPLQSKVIRNYIILTIVIPTLAAFLLTAGLGTSFIAWLVGHNVRGDHQTPGSFNIDEGTEGSMNEATLRGLTISSLTSCLVSLVNPIVMALLAYLVALRWLAAQKVFGTSREGLCYSDQLPTPLQYGLMLRLLTGEGMLALWDTTRYLAWGKNKRSATPRVFKTVFALALLSYMLTHAIGAADLWLHSTTSASVISVTVPVTTPLPYSIVFNDTLCSKWDGGSEDNACLVSDGGWAHDKPWIANIGLQIASNSSSDIALTTLSNSNDATVLIPRVTDSEVEFRAMTYGARANCQSLNSLCEKHNNITTSCTNVGAHELPFDPTRRTPTLWDPVTSVIFGRVGDLSIGPYHGYNDTRGKLASNPTTILLNLQWPTCTYSKFDPPSSAVEALTSSPHVNLYARCNVSFFKGVVRWSLGDDSGRYILKTEEPTDAHMTGILLPPLLYQYVTDMLASNLHTRVISDTSVTSIEAALNQELSRMAIGIAGGLFRFDPAIETVRIQQKIVGQYQYTSVLLFILLLYAYAVLILSVLVWGVIDFVWGDKRLFQDVALAQLRLSNPMAVVAALFPSSDTHVAPETCVMSLFDEEALGTPSRLYMDGNRIYRVQKWRDTKWKDHKSTKSLEKPSNHT